ncbi:hypothetical protein [Promicromonospora aerolata]|uniref:Uncharacterized protein n=1 Tax=Promicromonospora aerolata TaxID=195749 RepID=A0ABW4V2U5_9MICO
MGSDTYFSGSLTIVPPLNDDETAYLIDFAATRRCQRIEGPLALPGVTVDFNRPPAGQPGVWCHFEPDEDGTTIVWNESEKTYQGAERIAFLVTRLLAPSAKEYLDAHRDEDPRLAEFTTDHVVNGSFTAQGEEYLDLWGITVEDNQVTKWQAGLTPENHKPVVLPK